MDKLMILGPIGVGDALVINGLVRHFAETRNIILGVAHKNLKNIKYFFKDLKNIEYLVSNPEDKRIYKEQLYEMSQKYTCEKLFIDYWKQLGTRHVDDIGHDTSKPYVWSKSIYVNDAKIPEEIMYSKFKVERDKSREVELWKKLVERIHTTEYVITSSMYGNIKIDTNLPVVCIDKGAMPEAESDLITDYCTILERAQEIHCPDCGWAWLIEMCNLKVPNKYMYQTEKTKIFDNLNFPEKYFKNTSWTVIRDENYKIVKPPICDEIISNAENEIREKVQNQKFDKTFIQYACIVSTWRDIKNNIFKPNEKATMAIACPTGLGDYFVINGLVREFAKRYNILLGVDRAYKQNVSYMFRDLPNITYFTDTVNDRRNTAIQIVEKMNEMKVKEKLYLGYTRKLRYEIVPFRYIKLKDNVDLHIDWARNFYIFANLNPKIMFENFFVLRNKEREESFYKRVVEHLGTTDYITVSDHPTRGRVDRRKIPENNVKEFIVNFGYNLIESDCIFDYGLVIERSRAYHGTEGGFSWFVEMCQFNPLKKYLHMYRGGLDSENFPTGYYNTQWIVLR